MKAWVAWDNGNMAACQRSLETLLSFPGFVEKNLKHSVSEHLIVSELSKKWRREGSLRALQMETQSCYVLLDVSSHYVLMSWPERYGVRCRHWSSSSPALWISRDSVAVVHLARFVAGGLKSFQEKSACLVLSDFRHWGTTKSHMDPYGIK